MGKIGKLRELSDWFFQVTCTVKAKSGNHNFWLLIFLKFFQLKESV